MDFRSGDTFKNDGDDYYTSGIHVDDHFNKIECYGKTYEDAIGFRNFILDTLLK